MVAKSELLAGCLVGVACGDSIGLPYEGLKPKRVNKLIGQQLRQSLVFGFGMLSDDTEHAAFTLEALVRSNNVDHFQSLLAKKIRNWFLCLPAGIGLATLRSSIKLCLGFGAKRSAVFSAGNGAAMRAPIIGCFWHDDIALMKAYCLASTEITHNDPKAFYGAFACGLAASIACQGVEVSARFYFEQLAAYLPEASDEFMNLMEQVVSSVESGQSTPSFCQHHYKDKGVSGYIYHTAPAVIHCWLSMQNDYHAAIETMVRCGGDTDTTSAILGGIIACRVGEEGIPKDWVNKLRDWPLSLQRISALAKCVDSDSANKVPRYPTPMVFIRNMLFTLIVLTHGFRRLLPPY